MCHPEAPPGSTRPHPATARSRRRPPPDFCGLFCGLFCGRLCVVNTSAARDSEASRDPSPAGLIASDSRQAARASPAKPPRRPQCAGIARHQISNAQAACPPRMRRGCARAGAQLRLRGGGALSCRSSSRKRPGNPGGVDPGLHAASAGFSRSWWELRGFTAGRGIPIGCCGSYL